MSFKNNKLFKSLDKILQDKKIDAAIKAELLELPDENFFIAQYDKIDIRGLHHARETLKNIIARELNSVLLHVFKANSIDNRSYHFDYKSVGKRKLKNLCLDYLVSFRDESAINLAKKHYLKANNLTDRLQLLSSLLNSGASCAQSLLDDFYIAAKKNAFLIDRWFYLNSGIKQKWTLSKVKKLIDHPEFSYRDPNRVRALIGNFTQNNPANFHASDGSGYAFLTDQIQIIDKINPQLAARLLQPLVYYRKFTQPQRGLMHEALKTIITNPKLSKNLRELVEKSLGLVHEEIIISN